MKITYSVETDIMQIILRDAPVEESDEDKLGVIIDYDSAGNIVGIEILDASKRVGSPYSVEYAVSGVK